MNIIAFILGAIFCLGIELLFENKQAIIAYFKKKAQHD